MPLSDHEKTLFELVGTVASRYLYATVIDKVAVFNMDMFARLSILEGAAGVTPGTWLRHGARGFGAALEHFGPQLATAWTSARDEGVYNKALTTARRYLSSIAGPDAADLIQDMTINSSRAGGADRTKLFYTIGKKLRTYQHDLGNGRIKPRDSKVLGSIDRWVAQAALDELKSWRTRTHEPLVPGLGPGAGVAPTRGIDSDTRDRLLLLALQSPGGPGVEVRRIIDQMIDQHFPQRDRQIVRVFLQKIGEPKYRSAEQMRRTVERFVPERWFSQTLTVVRNEMMRDMNVSPQQLTNALGGKARKVFAFMRDKVGKDSRVQKIIQDLAQEIELLEPAVPRVAKQSELTEEQIPEQPYTKMIEWMRGEQEEDEEKEGSREEDELRDIFEKDEYMDWDAQVGPHAVFNRGPIILRVAKRFLGKEKSKEKGVEEAEAFRKWLKDQPVETRQGFVKPGDSKARQKIWDEFKKEYRAGKGKERPEEGEKEESKPREKEKDPEEAKAFKEWFRKQPATLQKDFMKSDDSRREIWEKFQKEQEGPKKPTPEPEPEKAAPPEKKTPTPPPKDTGPKSPKEVEKFLSTSPEQRLDESIKDTKGNTFFDTITIKDKPKIRKSVIKGKARISGRAEVSGCTVSDNAVVEDSAKVLESEISGHTRIRGATEINNAKIKGGSWDGQKIREVVFFTMLMIRTSWIS